MAVRVWISELKFRDDTILNFEKDDIIVFVGPNNAGKSASLKELAVLLKGKTDRGKILKDITIKSEGSESEFLDHLKSCSLEYLNGNPHSYYQGFGFHIYEKNANAFWADQENGLKDLFHLL